MDLCSCGTQATGQCTRCEASLCARHALSSRTPVSRALDELDQTEAGAGRDDVVVCVDCRADMVREDLGDLAGRLEDLDDVRGTAWLLALGVWGEREAAEDTYGAIVCGINGWDAHREVSPLDLALACLEEFGPELDPPSLKVVMRWHTPPQRTLMRVAESELRADVLGSVDGWIAEYGDGTTAAPRRLLLHARGEAYRADELTRIEPRTLRYAMPGVSTPAEVAAARAELVQWMGGIRTGQAEPAGELHCDRCSDTASVAVARIALGLD